MRYPTVQPTPAQKQTDGMTNKTMTTNQAASGKESGQIQTSEKLLNASRISIEGKPTIARGIVVSSTTLATSRHNEANAQ